MSPALQLLLLGAKSLALAGGLVGLLALLRRRSHAERAWVAGAAVAACLVYPLLELICPHLKASLPQPEALRTAMGVWPQAIRLQAATTTGWPPFAWLAPAALAAPAALGLAGTCLGLARLAGLTRRARPVTDAVWSACLARASDRLGVSRQVRLLASTEIASPVSWGLFRPIVLLDPATLATPRLGDAVIAHELGHVARNDWIMLVAGRIVRALLWFNPFARLLVREHRRLIELAADDLALRLGQPAVNYAEALIVLAQMSRGRVPALAASALGGAAPLGARITALLNPHVRRTSPRKGFRAAAGAGAVSILLAVSAISLAGPQREKLIARVPLSTAAGSPATLPAAPKLEAPRGIGSPKARPRAPHRGPPPGQIDPTAWDSYATLGAKAAAFDPTRWDWAAEHPPAPPG